MLHSIQEWLTCFWAIPVIYLRWHGSHRAAAWRWHIWGFISQLVLQIHQLQWEQDLGSAYTQSGIQFSSSNAMQTCWRNASTSNRSSAAPAPLSLHAGAAATSSAVLMAVRSVACGENLYAMA